MQPYGTSATSESISLSFKESAYYGLQDKAKLSFYSSNISDETFLTFSITSTSDPVGYQQEVIYYSSSVLGNGVVGFTKGLTKDGFIHVENGDTVYASYTSGSGKQYTAKTVWYLNEK